MEQKEILIEKLNKYAVLYGTNDERTLKISQLLDPYVTKDQERYTIS